MSRQIVLVGAGHAHLDVIRRAGTFRNAGLELSVVDPGDFWYSGLATGVLSGALPGDEDRVDVQRLCARHGVQHIAARAVGLAHRERRLWLACGRTLTFDALSFNVGSAVDTGTFEIAGAEARIWPVKPVRMLVDLHRALRHDIARGKAGVVAVVGGGASGCEVAANIATLTAGSRLRVLLVARSARLWPDAPQAAARRLTRVLAQRGVDIVLESNVTGIAGRGIQTADGRRFGADHVVLATGLSAPGVVRATGLPASVRGLAIGPELCSPEDPRVFAAGDCADFLLRALPCQGVHSVRQGPVLANNLIAALGTRVARRYKPRRHHLLILDMGDGTAIARRGRFWWHGRKSLVWKRRLDRGFMARFRY